MGNYRPVSRWIWVGLALFVGPRAYAEEGISFGTGWPLENGLVVTNHHVVGYADYIMLYTMDGNQTRARVEVRDTDNDLVLLRPENPEQLPPAIPIAYNPARLGQSVFTIGYPHVTVMGIAPKLTMGIITAVRGLRDDPRTYQISVGLQKGNSGGPLLNMNGEAVGITTGKLNLLWAFAMDDLPNNVSYAVKTDYLKPLIQSVIKKTEPIETLTAKKRSLEELAEVLQHSVMIVMAGDFASVLALNDETRETPPSDRVAKTQRVKKEFNYKQVRGYFTSIYKESSKYEMTSLKINHAEFIADLFDVPRESIVEFWWMSSYAGERHRLHNSVSIVIWHTRDGAETTKLIRISSTGELLEIDPK